VQTLGIGVVIIPVALYLAGGLVPMSAVAEEAAAPKECFDVIALPGDKPPYGSILLNRCTGATWLLAKSSTGDTFSFRWSPRGIEANEAVLSFPRPTFAQAPKQ